MQNNFNGTTFKDDDLMAVLLALKANIMKDLNVATIGVVKSIAENRITVEPYPKVTNEKATRYIECFQLQGLQLQLKDIVVVLFLDKDSATTIKKLKAGQTPSALPENTDLHKQKYGVIIGKL